jgi:predicted ATP-grasp superfamily ATP-dependent carboligase
MYLDLCGEPVPRDVAAEGRVWWVENYDLAAAAQSWREGTLSLRRWAGSLRHVHEPAWFARDDPAPFQAMCTQTAKAVRRRLLPCGER